MRSRVEQQFPGGFPGYQSHRRRHDDTRQHGHAFPHRAPGQNRPGHGGMGHYRHAGPGHRARSWRLSRGQFLLADHFYYQYSHRHRGQHSGGFNPAGNRNPARPEVRHAGVRAERPGFFLFTAGPQRGAGQGLGLAVHSHSFCGLIFPAVAVRDVGTANTRTHAGHPAVFEPCVQRQPGRNRHPDRRFVCGHFPDPHLRPEPDGADAPANRPAADAHGAGERVDDAHQRQAL